MKNNLVKREEFNINTPYKAKQMANVLAKHITDNRLSANIAGHDYVMVEGWQFAGGLMGLFPQITEVKEIAPMKWMATAQIVNIKTEKIVSTGYAICSKEEAKKRGFDEYAILSMAQTRAIGKAYRNYIGWIIKMAGYEATPAEEIKPDMSKVEEKKTKSNATTYKEQLWAELKKDGATDETSARKLIEKKTGIKMVDMKTMTEKEAQIKLFAYLNNK
jgi:hypothetical protein